MSKMALFLYVLPPPSDIYLLNTSLDSHSSRTEASQNSLAVPYRPRPFEPLLHLPTTPSLSHASRNLTRTRPHLSPRRRSLPYGLPLPPASPRRSPPPNLVPGSRNQNQTGRHLETPRAAPHPQLPPRHRQ